MDREFIAGVLPEKSNDPSKAIGYHGDGLTDGVRKRYNPPPKSDQSVKQNAFRESENRESGRDSRDQRRRRRPLSDPLQIQRTANRHTTSYILMPQADIARPQ
jgi:hypothetical protein